MSLLFSSADEAKACRVKTVFGRCPGCPASTHRESRTCGSGPLCSRKCWTRSSSTWWRTAGVYRRRRTHSLAVLQGLYAFSEFPFSHFSSSKYYEKEAFLMDLVDGPILASLLGNNMWRCKKLACSMSWSNIINIGQKNKGVRTFLVHFFEKLPSSESYIIWKLISF